MVLIQVVNVSIAIQKMGNNTSHESVTILKYMFCFDTQLTCIGKANNFAGLNSSPSLVNSFR